MSTMTNQNKATRDAFGEAIVELARTNPAIVVVNADLPSSLRLNQFIKDFPERYFQVGVAEQVMASVGSGLSLAGKIPIITSFAAFSPGLNWSQIRLAAISKLNIKIVSSHYGVNIGEDGASAQMTEDIAMMRVIPGMSIVTPADFRQTKLALKAVVDHYGPVYLRISRTAFPDVYADNAIFEFGKANVLRNGDSISIVASGSTVAAALTTSEILKSQNINAEVIDVHTIKPLDVNTLLASVSKTGKLLVVEEHQVSGGLGSAILEALNIRNFKFRLLGLNNEFGTSGNSNILLKQYSLDSEGIARNAKELLT